MDRLARPLVASAIILYCVTLGVAVRARQSSPPQFKTGVDATTLNVVVVDKNRKPVHGLTRDDFTVLEDNKPQRIVAFSEERLRKPVEAAPAWQRKFPSDVTTNTGDARRLIVILMTYTLEERWITDNRKRIAHAIVDRLGPDDSAAVVWTHRSDDAQDFTSDHAKLHAAIERTRLGTPYIRLRCVKESVVDALALAPEKRKLLINIGPGNTGPSIESKMPATIGMGHGAGEFAAFLAQCPPTPMPFAAMVQRANVMIYNISPMGLTGSGFDTDENPSHGRTFAESNTPERFVNEVLNENDSFYLIGYESGSSKPREAFRRLSVKVNRPGVEVYAPETWYEPGPTAKDLAKHPEKTPPPLLKAMSEALPRSRIALRTVVAPFATTGGKLPATVAIVLGMTLPGEKRGNAVNETVEIEHRAFDLDGHQIATRRETASVALRPDGTDARLELLSRIDLKPGRYQIRTSISSAVLNDTGSVYSDVFVPDFFDKPVSLSGIALATVPAVVAAPKEAFAGLMPIVPTSQRAFAAGSVAEVFARIYQKKPLGVAMAAEIRDVSDKVVAREEQLVPADRFLSTRSADFRWNLPLAKLAPGLYLLTLTSTANKASATQSLQFVVR